MKIILAPLFFYALSIYVGLMVLFCTLIFYPIVVMWEFKVMSWGEYMAYNYTWGAENPEDRIIEILEKQTFFKTIVRWLNFKYGIFL